MPINNVRKYLTVLLATSLLAGCQGNQTVTQTSDGGGGTPVDGGDTGGGTTDPGKVSVTANIMTNVADTVDSTGNLVRTLGTTISQQDLPLVGSITSGTGEVLVNTGDAVGTLATGLNDGLGSLTENENALGTTLAGVTGATSEIGNGVDTLGTTIESVNTLPVFAQLDAQTGLLTTLGGTASELGLVVTDLSDTLTLALTEDNGALNGLTTELTGVIRPLIAETEGGTQVIGQALVVGPVATNLLEQSGTAVVVLGGDLASNDNAVLASTGGTVQGVGQLVIDAGGLLSLADATDTGEALDLNSLLAGLDNNGSPLDALGSVLGADNGNLLSSVTDTVEGLTGGLSGTDGGLLAPVTGVVDGLTGGLSGTDGGLLAPVTDVVDGLTGGLSDTDGGLLSPVTDVVDGLTSGGLTGTDVGLIDPLLDTVDGLTGGLLGDNGGLLDPVTGTADGLQSGDGDLLGSATDILGGLTGTDLPSSETSANEGLVDTLDSTLLDPLLGGLL